ncbi:MAG: 1-(5-phosphoribosyl)-5-[Clostridia bacterium]|nr:1-(5-phosphoribosyl)-5-[(5-phosphoribosylamino)methylideneamino]imidazole-4-carboxamide isomerase [Clostridia bacterium]MBR0510562.1 1-(5-phosphoribosyl)-5-[(5-phosphoribosylamino)methylideneamino]imidazole-4-carboxamide isomerase [Clostridia bacterium]
MLIFPAIDLYGGKAVRLFKGDYNQMTVYSDRPAEVACDFRDKGAKWIHIVDLEGAKTGGTPNLETVLAVKKASGLLCEIGGGVRSMDVVERYLSSGIDRVILGTAAVTDEAFLKTAVGKYGEKVAVGVDLKDGYVAVKGWTEKSALTADAFFEKLEAIGVKTVICTDISKDGAMQGANHELYRRLSKNYSVDLTASGGVSGLEDVKKLAALGLYGAIIGKAYYTGAVDLADAIALAQRREL